VVRCQVLHLCFQATQFCNIYMKSVSSFMSITVIVFSVTYNLFSWRLTTSLSAPLLLSHTFIALNLKSTLHEIIYLLAYIMQWKKLIFNLCYSEVCAPELLYAKASHMTTTAMPPVTQESQLLWRSHSQTFRLQDPGEFERVFCWGGKKSVLWSGKYSILYIKLQLMKLKCIKLSQTFHTQFPQVQCHFSQTEKFYSILTSLFSAI
jgi:hypothetical protein